MQKIYPSGLVALGWLLTTAPAAAKDQAGVGGGVMISPLLQAPFWTLQLQPEVRVQRTTVALFGGVMAGGLDGGASVRYRFMGTPASHGTLGIEGRYVLGYHLVGTGQWIVDVPDEWDDVFLGPQIGYRRTLGRSFTLGADLAIYPIRYDNWEEQVRATLIPSLRLQLGWTI